MLLYGGGVARVSPLLLPVAAETPAGKNSTTENSLVDRVMLEYEIMVMMTMVKMERTNQITRSRVGEEDAIPFSVLGDHRNKSTEKGPSKP
jgi:hypothetical protein